MTHRRPLVINPRAGGALGVALRAWLALFVWLGVAGGLGAAGLYTWFARDLPRLDQFDELLGSGVTRFEAADGMLVGEWYQERRVNVPWNRMPRTLVLAFLAAEDSRFFAHTGVDLRGIARAMVTNLRAGGIREGASTITQQLAKQLVGTEKSYARKVKEAILARRLEDLFSKQQILTWYLNGIYLGHGSYGVRAAAQNYFRKDIWGLELAEVAMIAGLPQSPSRVNPAVDMPRARERMGHVLDQMTRRGWVTEEEREAALGYEMKVHRIRDTLGDHVPYYAEHVRKDVAQRYAGGEDGEGSWLERELRVSMHVEPSHQRVASAALGRALEGLARKQGFPGPLGQLDRATFFERSRPWLPAGGPQPGDRLLARVKDLTKDLATLELADGLLGTLTLEKTRWAGRYTEHPRDAQGRRVHEGSVSFQPKLKALTDALAAGDVVLTEVVAEGAPLQLELVPVPLVEGALLSYPSQSGGVDTLVGGWDFDRSQVHRAFATRQTGSTMKAVVYGKAYDLGLPPSALFSGAPFREGAYNPTGARSKDDMILWDALTKSENSVSLRVLQYVLNHTSLADYQSWGRALGLPRALQGHTSEVLGADQTPAGMAHAFGVYAARGYAPVMPLVRKVVDGEGRVLERAIPPGDPHASLGDTLLGLWDQALAPRQPLIRPQTAYLMTANLREVVQRGTATRAKVLAADVVGKTGTLPYDVWFDGFSWERVAVAWVGADRRERPLGKSEKVNKVYGGDTALPAWIEFMSQVDVHRNSRLLLDRPPADVVWLRIDPKTGLLARSGGRTVPHMKGTEPSDFSYEETSPENIHGVEGDF